MRRRIVFVISSLATGGAQMMLYKLMCTIDRDRFEPSIVSLTGANQACRAMIGHFETLDVPVHIYEMSGKFTPFRSFFGLVRFLKRVQPDMVMTWMYHADLVGGLASFFAGRIPLIWNIRHSDLRPGVDKPRTLYIARICAWLSRVLPQKIVCCAHRAREVHAALGYDHSRMLVIPNGFDLQQYLPDKEAGQQIRRELNLTSDQLIVGMVARYHPMKGFASFISAAGKLAVDNQQVNFVLCGSGVTWENDALTTMIDEVGLRDRFKLLGPRTDVAYLQSAFDLFTSPSLCGEGFSNVVGEAMCCGVPCVVTDVGDSAWIVGTTGRVIPPGSPEPLADAWRELLLMSEENRQRMGVDARSRMQENFSLSRITEQYQELFLAVGNSGK